MIGCDLIQRLLSKSKRKSKCWQLDDHDWLNNEYINKTRTAAEIARELKVDTTTVRYHLIRECIQIRSSKETNNLPHIIKQNSDANSGVNNPMYGKHHSEYSKHLMSINQKPHIVSDRERKIHHDMWAGSNNPMYDVHRCGELNPAWRGGISFEPYCPKFNRKFKEHIREKFGRSCFICGKTESDSGRKLYVHHVDYDKLDICNGKEWPFVPLCMHCHNRTNSNRWYWFNLLINYWAIVYWNEGSVSNC